MITTPTCPTRCSFCSTPLWALINVEQNNIIKVLTIVSVVGVPPTLVASMYGMNFRHMPRTRLGLGIPVRSRVDRIECDTAASLVQASRLALMRAQRTLDDRLWYFSAIISRCSWSAFCSCALFSGSFWRAMYCETSVASLVGGFGHLQGPAIPRRVPSAITAP